MCDTMLDLLHTRCSSTLLGIVVPQTSRRLALPGYHVNLTARVYRIPVRRSGLRLVLLSRPLSGASTRWYRVLEPFAAVVRYMYDATRARRRQLVTARLGLACILEFW